MKVSVIIPSYNQGLFLEETILSVLSQDYTNIEIIVIDGNSSDNSIDIIRKYNASIYYWVSEKDDGQSHAINKGIAKSNGEIVTWLNSDDTLLPGAITKIVDNFLYATEDTVLIHGGAAIIEGGKKVRDDFGYPDQNLERYLSGMAFPQPGTFFKRDAYEQVGGLRQDLHFGMDYDLFARLALIGKFMRLDCLLSNYRLHSDSKSICSSHLFIDDWTTTFGNILKNLEMKKFHNELIKLGIIQENLIIDNYNFTFKNYPKNHELMFFFFLSYVLRSDYRTGNFSRAKIIGDYLHLHYSILLRQHYEIRTIISRLKFFPVSVIKFFRSLRNP